MPTRQPLPPLWLHLTGTPADLALVVDTLRMVGVITHVSQPLPAGPPDPVHTQRREVLIDVVGPVEHLRPHLAPIGRYHSDPDAFLTDDLTHPPR